MDCSNASKMSHLTCHRMYVFILFWITLLTVDAIQWRVEPRDQVVFRASTVTLTCTLPSLRVEGDIMHWLYSPDGGSQQMFLTSNKEISPEVASSKASRYNPQTGPSDFHLTIQNTEDADSGYYACMIYNELPTRRAVSRLARVTVVSNVIPEGSPTCSITPMHPQPGDQVFFSCASLAGNAVSVLQWSKGNVELPSTISIGQGNLQKLATVTKILKGVDNHVEYVCTESWPVVGSVTSQCRISPFDIPINVSIVPSDVELPVSEASKGVTFTCSAKAYPPTVYYNWFFDGYQVSQYPSRFSVLEGGRKLRISKINYNSERNFDRNPMEIRCNVRNSVGEVRTANAYLRIYKGRRQFGQDGGETDEFEDRYQHPAIRLNRLLITLIIISSLILCALIIMLLACSRRRTTRSSMRMDMDTDELSNVFDAVDISSPLASITSSVEYAKPLKDKLRNTSYTPLCKDQMKNDTLLVQEHRVRSTRFSNIDKVVTESIYENATRFSLPDLPGLPLTRFEKRPKTSNITRKEKFSM